MNPTLKFVYILTGDVRDYYAEQTLASIYSLKFHNPGARIVVLSDSYTHLNSHKDTIDRIKELTSEIIEIDVPEFYTNKQKSRFLKTSIPHYIDEDFLYIDGDTLITSDLSELDKRDFEIGATIDSHGDLPINYKLFEYLKTTGKRIWKYNNFFNGGVLLVKNNKRSKDFFADWHKLWKEELSQFGVDSDQPSLSQTDLKNNFLINELSGEYNCQIFVYKSNRYLLKAKIIHYFADGGDDNAFPLKNKDNLNYIRQNGITGKLLEIVRNPLQAYIENCKLITGNELKMYDSAFSKTSRFIGRKFGVLPRMLEYFYKFYKRKFEKPIRLDK